MAFGPVTLNRWLGSWFLEKDGLLPGHLIEDIFHLNSGMFLGNPAVDGSHYRVGYQRVLAGVLIRMAINLHRPSFFGFIVVHLGVSQIPEGLFRASSIGYYPGGSVEKSYNYLEGRLQEEDLFIGFGVPTMDDASLAPGGKHIVSIHHPLPVDQFPDWRKHRDAIADRLLEKLERIFPGLRASIDMRSRTSPAYS